VTFRQADTLPQEKLRLLERLRQDWERTHPPPRSEVEWRTYAREVTNSAERWLDEGYGGCHFRYRRSCWSIMPNHCHAVIRPFQGYVLEDLLGAIKGVTARFINVALGRTGALWEEGSYGRIVRDEKHLWRVIQYIGRNPRLAGLETEASWRCWVHPEWEAAGWGFRDEDQRPSALEVSGQKRP